MKFLLFLSMAISLNAFASMTQEIKTLEDLSGGRIGVSAIDMTTKKMINYRADERFPFCSTFKVMGRVGRDSDEKDRLMSTFNSI